MPPNLAASLAVAAVVAVVAVLASSADVAVLAWLTLRLASRWVSTLFACLLLICFTFDFVRPPAAIAEPPTPRQSAIIATTIAGDGPCLDICPPLAPRLDEAA